MTTVTIQPRLIRWARERAGLAVGDLVEKFPKFPLWEMGDAMPTMRQLEALAVRTRTPFGYFFLPEPPEEELPITDYRTMKDGGIRRPSPDLLETVQTMQRRQDWMRDYLIEEGEDPLPFVGTASKSDRVAKTVEAIRHTLGLTEGWARGCGSWDDALRHFRNAVEGTGVLVATNGVVGNNTQRKLDVSEFRGFVLSDRYAPLVFVNGADAKAAQMFTLTHEVAHVWLGRGGLFDLPDVPGNGDSVEKYCNHVAAELLVPEIEFRERWSTARHAERPFADLARWFKVSEVVAARRALELRLMGLAEFDAFYDEYRKRLDSVRSAKPKSGGGDYFRNQDVRLGRRFGYAVVRAAKEGRLLYRDAYALTGLRSGTFQRYMKHLVARG